MSPSAPVSDEARSAGSASSSWRRAMSRASLPVKSAFSPRATSTSLVSESTTAWALKASLFEAES